MSFDILGDNLSGFSAVGQAFAGSIKAFELWQRGKAIAEKGTLLQIKMEMQAARLKAWGQDWGISNNAHIYHPRFKEFGALATRYMSLIEYQTNQLESLDSEFPALKNTMQPPSIETALQRMTLVMSTDLRKSIVGYRQRDARNSIEGNATLQERYQVSRILIRETREQLASTRQAIS